MKKNGFLTFFFSFIPGCGLMFLGYMKKGLQYMLMFAAAGWLAFLSTDFNVAFGGFHYLSEWITALFVIILPVVWLFQFFDTMHSRKRMIRLEIVNPTDDGFFYPQNLFVSFPMKKSAAIKSFAVVLIIFGSAALLTQVMDMAQRYLIDEVREYVDRINQYLFPVLISLALVIAGLRLLRGSRKKSDIGENNGGEE